MLTKSGTKVPKGLPVVLIIEDNHLYHREMVKAFEGKARCIVCEDVPMAQKVVRRRQYDFVVVGLDACLGGEPNTRSLCREIRSLYPCPIIAMSSNKEYSEELMKNGASDISTKEDMPRLALSLIKSGVT